MTDCDCSEEYGPCESHCIQVIARDGASSRTADDVAYRLVMDAVDLGARLSKEDESFLAGLVWSDDVGTGWVEEDEPNMNNTEGLYELADKYESEIYSLPYKGRDAQWHVAREDGYQIMVITGGPLFDHF